MKKALKNRKIEIVTTFSPVMYNEFVRKYLESWTKFLSEDVQVTLYVDDSTKEYNSRYDIINLENTVPELTEFKQKNKDYKPKDFRFDAVRFSHKSFVISHAGLTSSADMLVWLDSDIVMFEEVSRDWLSVFLPGDTFSSYLGREGNFTETGFLAFDLTNDIKTEFFNKWKWYYNSNFIMEGKQGKTDCHVFDLLRKEFESQNKIKTKNLNIPENGHAFENVFGKKMSHHKGTRKIK